MFYAILKDSAASMKAWDTRGRGTSSGLKPVDTSSKNFKSWFGKSKIVNPASKGPDPSKVAEYRAMAKQAEAEGNTFYQKAYTNWANHEASLKVTAESPKVMYHATPKTFDTFKIGRADSIFVAEHPADAATVAYMQGKNPRRGEYDEGVNIMPVYVRAENPFDPQDAASRNSLADYLRKHDSTINNPPPFFDEDHQEMDLTLEERIAQDWQIMERPKTIEYLKKHKHDGYWTAEYDSKARSLAVFLPGQLKSALSNTGEFSRSDDNIHKND